MIQLIRYVSVALLFVVTQLLPFSTTQGEEQQNVEESIRAAWQQRADDLKNFQCTASLNRIVQTGGGLFDEPEPGGSRQLDSTIHLH